MSSAISRALSVCRAEGFPGGCPGYRLSDTSQDDTVRTLWAREDALYGTATAVPHWPGIEGMSRLPAFSGAGIAPSYELPFVVSAPKPASEMSHSEGLSVLRAAITRLGPHARRLLGTRCT